LIFDGREIEIQAGDTVAAALYRAGVRVFRRGLLCYGGNCDNCELTIDGVPNSKSCITPARADQSVGSPSLVELPLAAEESYAYEHHFTDVAVIGGGRSGVAAALEQARQGHRVYLVEREATLGGNLRYSSVSIDEPEEPTLTVLKNATCFGLYEGNLLGIQQGNTLIHLRAERVIIATGAYETAVVFDNNHLPGVMLSTGVERLLFLNKVVPGNRAVVIEAGGPSIDVTEALRSAGVLIAAIVSIGDVEAAEGTDAVTHIRTRSGRISCDLAVICGPRVPELSLIAEAGGKLQWSEGAGAFVPAGFRVNISAVGSVTGTFVNRLAAPPPPSAAQMVCFCMDIDAETLVSAIRAGFDHVETLKRFTKAGKGHCQGRMCNLSIIQTCARETGRSMADTGTTVFRSPNRAISLGVLAGAEQRLVRKTPLHAIHDAAGAVWMNMGAWKRPRYYRTPEEPEESAAIAAEYKAVRERAGVIDIGTLGKLDLRGKDSAPLLDKVYAGNFSNLAVNRTRYAVLCDESGTLLDDGTVSRVAPDRYFLTTTTGNLEFVQQWLDSWAIGTGWDVNVTNLTSGLASVNLAGPAARAILSKLTDVDLSAKAFPYMACAEATVAGIAATLLRIGFVGETGWEIHIAAECGTHLWGAILEAGAEFNIRPFGVECQRLLRLEKRHVIVGVDTDGLSNPLDANLEWAVRLDKADFVGRSALKRLAHAGSTDRLVGFVMDGETAPLDGSAIVQDGKLVGRVTSARYSPTRGEVVGLAWLPAEASGAFAVHDREARIVSGAFYDPQGGRMRQ
jgi:sarcosine oxidase subunit alpha